MEDYLKQLGISVENQDKISQFIYDYKHSIDSFIKEKWEEYQQNVERTQETQTETEKVVEVEFLVENQEEETSSEQIVEIMEIKKESENLQKKGVEDYREEDAKIAVFSSQLKSKYISFPNGKVNQEYIFGFDITESMPEIREVWFEGLTEIGLDYNPETKEIKGIPSKPGDLKVRMKCKRKDWEEGKPVFERDIIIIVNPDPKSLWNNITTPEDIEYYKPDWDKLFVKVESKKNKQGLFRKEKIEPRKDMVAASQRGRSHAHEGKPRDDDFALHFDDLNEWYTLTVADGAGSAKCSRRGSQIASETVVQVCKELINDNIENLEKTINTFNEDKSQGNRNEVGKILYGIIGAAVFKSYKNIEKEAQEKGYLIKDYSTTLIVSICKKFSFGWFVSAFWVGDGGIGIYDNEKQYLKVLGEADGGEFAGQTRFLTMSEIIQPTEICRRLRFDLVDDFTALILMTDGVTDPKFETDANLLKIDKWNDLWNDLSREVDFSDDNEASADQLLGWLDFWSQGNHDDRTIAILF